MLKNYTLVICRRNVQEGNGVTRAQVLLGMKKRGFGVDKYNGFGGKVEPNESMREAAVRELAEESGLHANALTMRGTLLFYMRDSSKIMNVGVYECRDFSGDLAESDEMVPRWFDESDIPLDRMWPDDAYWMPCFLSSVSFCGRCSTITLPVEYSIFG